MKDSRQQLWSNLSALMKLRYGKENLNRLAKDPQVSPGTIFRIKEQRTSVGLDVLDKLAYGIGVNPENLISPFFDPLTSKSTPQNLSHQAQEIASALAAIQDKQVQAQAYSLAKQVVDFGRGLPSFARQDQLQTEEIKEQLIPNFFVDAQIFVLTKKNG